MIFIYDYKKLVNRKVKYYAKFFHFPYQPLIMHKWPRAIFFPAQPESEKKAFCSGLLFPYPLFRSAFRIQILVSWADRPPWTG
jgi:hypothetical protein